MTEEQLIFDASLINSMKPTTSTQETLQHMAQKATQLGYTKAATFISRCLREHEEKNA